MIAAWRLFEVEVLRLRRLSTSFLRFTFGGDDLKVFADNGFDQRIKVVFPPGDRRTYTVRAVRESEVDVDFVMHPGGNGPAARWAEWAKVGDRLNLIGPDSRFDGPHGGLEFRPPEGTRTVLLAGDETAVPAVSSILECLPSGFTGAAILEVPHADDRLTLKVPDGIELTWYTRGGQRPGSLLVPAVTAAAELLLPQRVSATIEEAEPLPWEVPDEPIAEAAAYTWLAAEAGTVRTLRRHLIGERGLDRRSVALMGYWRLGHAEPTE